MSRILVVEDTLDLLEIVQSNLELEEYEVFVATRAAQAVVLASTQQPDLIVLDLGLPDKDGYHVLREVRDRGILCPVLILSARNQEADKVQGFRLGADDYVTKPFSVIELLARVGAMLRRSRWQQPAAVERGATSAEPLTDQELRDKYTLTPRQIVVARLLGEGCSNGEIAQRLAVSFFTARNHAEQVLMKLGVPNRAAVGARLFGH